MTQKLDMDSIAKGLGARYPRKLWIGPDSPAGEPG
jgi:hypothetical protein